MEVSTVTEEFVTTKTLTRIVYNGHEDTFIDLAPPDIVHSGGVVSATLYFGTNVGGNVIKQALQKASEEHFELCGRIVSHSTQCFQLKVEPEGWFPFVEQSCSLTVHEALAKCGQIQATASEEGIVVHCRPLLFENVDIDRLRKGNEPLLKCKLTHFADGYCALGFAFAHALMDGQRFVDLLVDIGKAARGLEIAPKTHDRTLMWPDVFLKKIQVSDLDPTKFPRKASSEVAPLNLSTLTSQTENFSSLLLHFPEELLVQLKTTLSKHLSQGEYLSTADIVAALVWLVSCEADVADSNVKTLSEQLKENLALTFVEAIANGVSWIPSNYTGNAMLMLPLKYQETSTDVEKDSYIKLLLNAALTVRREILGARGHQAVLAKHFATSYYVVNDVTLYRQMASSCKAMYLSSWSKMGFEEVDFGGGCPCFIDCPIGTPLLPEVVTITPGLKSGGVFVTMFANRSKQDSLFNSRVLKECASGVNFVFGTDLANPEFNLQL